MFIRLYCGSSDAGSPVYFDNIQLESGLVATPWLPPGNAQGLQFDGINDVLQTLPLCCPHNIWLTSADH